MKDYKILLDLSPILSSRHPFSGIPQELRVLFKLFAEIEQTQPIGLLCSSNRVSVNHEFKKCDNPVDQAFLYTDFFLRQEEESKPFRTLPIKQQVSELIKLVCKLFKKNYTQFTYDKSFDDYIWRKCFNNCIDSYYKTLILNQTFTLSDYNKFLVKARTLLNMSTASLQTEGIDFAIFSNGLPQSPVVSKGTIPIVRFHDAIPLLYPDTVANINYSKLFAKSLLESAKHAFFVCNSAPVREDLVRLIPHAENKSTVIPIPVLTDGHVKINKQSKLDPQVFASRAATHSNAAKIKVDLTQADYSNYIISVSTLEPRKNFISLIRAWEKIRFEYDKHLKLIIVGSIGWKHESIYEAMAPHIGTGQIIHLEKVPVDELRMLYAGARAFVFPTYCEGYGNTPIEAMHAHCPVVVSDIPTVRWVLGDAALYCNPYDVASIADAIARLLYSNESQELSQTLIAKGLKTIEKYSTSSIANQWLTVFDKLKSQPKGH